MATQNFTNLGGTNFIDEFYNAEAAIAAGIVGAGSTQNFIMRGIDNGAPSYPTYHYWIVQDNPDSTGSQTTPPNGGPLSSIIIFQIFES